MIKISLIMPVRNRKELTKNILHQLDYQINGIDRKNILVVVIDDGSSDGTSEMIRTEFPSIHLIQGDGSLWWTGAISMGMKYAIEKLEVDYIVWLNDDICLPDDFIVKLIEICNSSDFIDTVIGGIISDATYPDWIVFSGMVNKTMIRSIDRFAEKETMEVDTLNGNLAIIPRLVVDKIGLPDAKRFNHYGGDFEFLFRAKNAGIKVVLSSRIQATTDYQVGDLIRYMPPWIQWYLAPNFAKRKEILQGFTNLKTHYNIWHMVNINHCEVHRIHKWKYCLVYFRQILKVLSSQFWSKTQKNIELTNYLKLHNVPDDITAFIMANNNISNK